MIDSGTDEIHVKKVFDNVLYFFFRRLKKVLLWIVFLVVGAIGFHFIQSRTYNINYYISSDYISGQKIDLILTDIKHILEQKRYALLSGLLQVSESDLKKIKSFKIIIEDPEYMLSSNVNPSPGFYFNETNTQIKILLSDSLDVNTLVDGLNHFITRSNYFQKIKKNEQVVIDMVNKNLEDQKVVLDSMNQINLTKFVSPNSNTMFANDISEIKRNIYSIEERLINNKRELVRIESPVNLINYPVLKRLTFQESILLAFLKSFIIMIAIPIIVFAWGGIHNAYKQFKETE
jgi:hypothetical protein